MQVLFLDFDGVLNSKQHFLMTKNDKLRGADTLEVADLLRMKHDTNKNNMWVLGYIMEKLPDLKIVISSAWGLHYSLEQFQEFFKVWKLDGSRVIGITPRKMSSYRCNEINWWLQEQNENEEHDCPKEEKPEDDCATCEKNAKREYVDIKWAALDDHEIFRLDEPEVKNQFLTDSWVGVTMNDAFKIIRHFKPDFREPYFGI